MSQTPADLLRQISSFDAEKRSEGVAAPVMPRPAESQKTGLIQVISATDAQPQEPRYRLQLRADAAGAPRRVELTVELPMVSSVSDCQLRISKVSAPTPPWTILMSPSRIQSVRVGQLWKKKNHPNKMCWLSVCVSLEDDILLEVEALYYLRVDFPADVEEDTASAVFNKKKRTLTLTVDASDSDQLRRSTEPNPGYAIPVYRIYSGLLWIKARVCRVRGAVADTNPPCLLYASTGVADPPTDLPTGPTDPLSSSFDSSV